MRNERNDVHQPSNIIPFDYDYLFSYSYPGSSEPPYNVALLEAVRTGKTQQEPIWGVSDEGRIVAIGYRPVDSPWGRLPFFDKVTGSQSGCAICGAHYRHGDAWLHVPSGEVVLIGHMCADKMGRTLDRHEWTAAQRRAAQLRKSARYQAEKYEKAQKVLSANPGLAEALDTNHNISRDLLNRLRKFGSLTDRQIELAFKLHREASATEVAASGPPKITPPTGRVDVEGIIVNTKVVHGDYGSTIKMLLEVTRPDGVYRLFGTMPRALSDDQNVVKGSKIRMKAEVQPKEEGFGYYLRPTSALLVPQEG